MSYLSKNNNDEKDKEINDLKNKLNNANKIIEQQKNTIEDLQKKLNNYTNDNNNTIQALQNTNKQKEAELIKLRTELTNIKNNLSQSKIVLNKSQMMALHFTSTDQNVHFSIPCIESDIFAEVEEKLYKEYPEYRETNNTFLAQGKQILRFKTIGQNKIGSGITLTLVIPQD